MKKLKKSSLPRDRCYVCGVAKMSSSNCMAYLCGKCYVKKKHEDRKKKGLK